jgi:hypothetical protein
MAVVGLYTVFRVVRHYYGGISALFTKLAAASPAHLTLPGTAEFCDLHILEHIAADQSMRVLYVAAFIREFLWRRESAHH